MEQCYSLKSWRKRRVEAQALNESLKGNTNFQSLFIAFRDRINVSLKA